MLAKKNYSKRVRSSKKGQIQAIVDREMSKTSDTKWFVKEVYGNFGVVGTAYGDLTAVPQGSSSLTRVGDRLRLKNLSYCITLADTSAALTYSYARVTIIQWFPSSATSPVDTQVFHFSTWNSPLRMDTRTQYKVLFDKQVALNATTANNYPVFTGTIHFKEPTSVQFEAGTTTGSNKIYVIFETSLLRAAMTYGISSMLRFYDY